MKIMGILQQTSAIVLLCIWLTACSQPSPESQALKFIETADHHLLTPPLQAAFSVKQVRTLVSPLRQINLPEEHRFYKLEVALKDFIDVELVSSAPIDKGTLFKFLVEYPAVLDELHWFTVDDYDNAVIKGTVNHYEELRFFKLLLKENMQASQRIVEVSVHKNGIYVDLPRLSQLAEQQAQIARLEQRIKTPLNEAFDFYLKSENPETLAGFLDVMRRGEERETIEPTVKTIKAELIDINKNYDTKRIDRWLKGMSQYRALKTLLAHAQESIQFSEVQLERETNGESILYGEYEYWGSERFSADVNVILKNSQGEVIDNVFVEALAHQLSQGKLRQFGRVLDMKVDVQHVAQIELDVVGVHFTRYE